MSSQTEITNLITNKKTFPIIHTTFEPSGLTDCWDTSFPSQSILYDVLIYGFPLITIIPFISDLLFAPTEALL